MPSFSTLLAASTLAALVASKPVPQAVPTKKGFTINQSIAKPFRPGPVQLQKAYKKFNKAVPTDVAAAASDGSVSATPEQYDAEYLSPVEIGGQTLNLDFDTGSADLYVQEHSTPRFVLTQLAGSSLRSSRGLSNQGTVSMTHPSRTLPKSSRVPHGILATVMVLAPVEMSTSILSMLAVLLLLSKPSSWRTPSVNSSSRMRIMTACLAWPFLPSTLVSIVP